MIINSEILKDRENCLVSIVIPVYNVERYLAEALGSIINQTYDNLEIICVNDGSTDSSQQILELFAQQDSRIIIISQENKGLSGARNAGLKLTTGKYVYFFDSDDLLEKDAIEGCVKFMEMHQIPVMSFNGDSFFEKGAESLFSRSYIQRVSATGVYDTVEYLKINPSPITCVVLYFYRRDFLINNELDCYEGIIHEDELITPKVIVLADEIGFLKKTYFLRRVRINSIMTSTENRAEHLLGCMTVAKELEDFMKIHPYEMAEVAKRNYLNHKKTELFNAGMKYATSEDLQFCQDIAKHIGMMYLYKVSVIMPIHNAAEVIDNTLNDVLRQSLRDIEIILVENGSTDNTLELLSEFAKRDNRVKLFSIGPSNAGHARNVGLEKALGQYALFLDADDRFHTRMLELLYKKAVADSAEVVLFKARRRYFTTGLYHNNWTFGFKKEQMPAKRPFKFNQITGNPYTAFNPGPCDKFWSLKYLRKHGLKYQEIPVSNDGYFSYIAMTQAVRITTLDEVLITYIMGHGENITYKHDKYFTADFDMKKAVLDTLATLPYSDRNMYNFRVRIIGSLRYALTETFKTDEGMEKYFKLLVGGGLEQLGVLDIDTSRLSEWSAEQVKLLNKVNQYGVDDFKRFKEEIWKPLKLEASKTRLVPNKNIRETKGRYIFGQNPEYGENTIVGLFSIVLEGKDTSNISLTIDFMYMGNYVPLVKDTLNISISMQNRENSLVNVLHQVDWDKGEDIFTDHIYYTFVENVFTIHARYVEQYTGFAYNITNISSREGKVTYSTTINNAGYNTELLPPLTKQYSKITAVLKSNTRVGLDCVYGRRTIFRIPSNLSMGIDLFSVELPKYKFNNVSLAIEIADLPNNQPVSYDTLYLGFYLEEIEDRYELRVYQAEWLYQRAKLVKNIYYHILGNTLFVGARFNELWGGYNYKIVHIAGREFNEDYQVTNLAPERVYEELVCIPKEAVFSQKRIK